MNQNIADAIKYIWKNEQKLHTLFRPENISENGYKILNETTEYFWNNIDRIAQNNNVPN